MLFRTIVDRGIDKRGRRGGPFCGAEYPLWSLLDGYQCARHDEHVSYGNLGSAVPPFGCTFSSAQGLQNVLAVANEEGVVRLYNTEARQTSVSKVSEWLAHENAVFDVAWVPGEACLVTASGDQTARLWDVKSGEQLGSFRGHQCSLKSVAFSPQEKAVFCTGGRDGNIMVWDTRCSKKDGFYRQVKQISGAHNKTDRCTPSKAKKKRGMAPSVDSQQSVTVVLFRDEHTLISCGAVDGTIKMWDLRRNYTAYHHDLTPLQTYLYPGSSTRKLGFSGLVLDSTSSNLFANCTDDNIYRFSVSGMKTAPVAVYTGHRNSSFYVKSSISPDNQFLASGSSDQHAYIWKISNPDQAPMLLQGHSQEVTSVSWCPTDFTKIASCSDDNTIRIWRLNRGADGAKSSTGEANLVGWACPKPEPANKSPDLELIPAQRPLTNSLGPIASPQPAACALSLADLPLASITSVPPELKPCTPPHKASLATSIHRWFARTPDSPGEQRTPPLRKVLSPCPQSPARTAPSPTERRAKRRLETGEGPEQSGACAGACDCMAELSPAPKRSRDVDITCCGPSREIQASGLQGTEPSSQVDKENNCPAKADWLSVISQRLKRGQGSPSPLPRSPGSNKRQDSRTPTSPVFGSPQSKISSYFQRKPAE
ncbi:denticleless protein homolog [Denticeps clupeoides]|uniref:denticleless protein homolog n=1 Tax=Denticeps clupeoides TaxID=299321 RepID=UPI0010A3A8F8|nr:denticleless protein homolog [Denticeps clupeoides]